MKQRSAPSLEDGSFADDERQRLGAAISDAWDEVRVTLETVTPVCGGGAHAGKPDLLLPFRPRAIRNGVAHWWWLIFRNQFGSADDLWREYALTFGARSGAEHGGPAAFVVARARVDMASLKCGYWWPFKHDDKTQLAAATQGLVANLAYALFPARGTPKSGDDQPAESVATVKRWASGAQVDGLPGFVKAEPSRKSPLVQPETLKHLLALFGTAEKSSLPSVLLEPGAKVDITFRICHQRNDTRPFDESRRARLVLALRAWLLAGGFGSRTSRGLGAFKVVTLVPGPRLAQAFANLRADDLLREFCGADGQSIVGVNAVRTNATFDSPYMAWHATMAAYRGLRQVRLPGQDHPGLSVMPDADVVRTLQGLWSYGHKPRHPAAVEDGARALTDLALGAPVRIEFKGKGEPKNVELAIWVDNRMARFPSPVRFRPVLLENGKWAGLCLVLPSKQDLAGRPAAMKVDGDNGAPVVVKAEDWQLRDAAYQPTALAKKVFAKPGIESAYGVAALPADAVAYYDAVARAGTHGPLVLWHYLAQRQWVALVRLQNPKPGAAP